MLSGQQKHKNAYDMITLGIKNTMEFYRFLNEEKKKKSRNRKVIVMNDMKYIIESVLFSKIEKEKRSQALQQMDMRCKKVPKETEIIAEGEILASDNIKKMNKIEILAKRGMRDRILIYFDLMMQRTGSNQFHLNMNREQFARFLGVNRCALSDELNKMKKEKIIDFHKNDFTVLQ